MLYRIKYEGKSVMVVATMVIEAYVKAHEQEFAHVPLKKFGEEATISAVRN